jgi:phage baseplate assembly protein W
MSLKKRNLFKDLDLDFTPHPVTGDIRQKVDGEAVKRSVRNLVQINRHEKPFHPEIDARITRLLFEPASPLIAMAIRSNIIDMIRRYERRAQINDVLVVYTPDNNSFEVTISFTIVNSNSVYNVSVSLERLH